MEMISIFLLLILLVSSFVPYIMSTFHKDTKGMIICSGEGDIYLELLSIIEQIRNRPFILSKLPIAIAHCNEISENYQNILLKSMNISIDIKFIDICEDKSLNQEYKNKLKGFYCKPMALLHSPFHHTIIYDTDVIWLEDPIDLFDSYEYIQTGTLFFRDRLTITKNKLTLTAGQHRADHVMSYIHSISTQLEKTYENEKNNQQNLYSHKNKTYLLQQNAFWRSYVTGNEQTMDHMQDSSVILINILKQHKLLVTIRLMLINYNIGYGDKEIYWLASTAADIPYAFEPFLSGSLGNCGTLLHFHPNFHNESLTKPLYINAEYLIDMNKIKLINDFLDLDGNILLRTKPKLMNELNTPIFPLKIWKNMKHGFYPCGSCELYTCIPAEYRIIQEVSEFHLIYCVLFSLLKVCFV